LLIDAGRAARPRPVTVQAQPAEDARDDTGLDQILDRQLVTCALQHLSPAHRTVLVEAFYCGGTTATVARRLGIPPGTARSRLHYALQALRQHLHDRDATAA
jgi:RNA polymerase sigma-70 factor (ECF subfamily)